MSKVYRSIRLETTAYDSLIWWAKSNLPYGTNLSDAVRALVQQASRNGKPSS